MRQVTVKGLSPSHFRQFKAHAKLTGSADASARELFLDGLSRLAPEDPAAKEEEPAPPTPPVKKKKARKKTRPLDVD